MHRRSDEPRPHNNQNDCRGKCLTAGYAKRVTFLCSYWQSLYNRKSALDPPGSWLAYFDSLPRPTAQLAKLARM